MKWVMITIRHHLYFLFKENGCSAHVAGKGSLQWLQGDGHVFVSPKCTAATIQLSQEAPGRVFSC